MGHHHAWLCCNLNNSIDDVLVSELCGEERGEVSLCRQPPHLAPMAPAQH